MCSSITVLNSDKTEFDFSNVNIVSHYNIVLHCVYDPFGDFDNEFAFLSDPKYDANTLIILWHAVEQGDFDPVWMNKLDHIVESAPYRLVYLTGCSHKLNIKEFIDYKFDLRFFPVFDIRSADIWNNHGAAELINAFKTKKFSYVNSKDIPHRRYILGQLLKNNLGGNITYRCQEGIFDRQVDLTESRGFSAGFIEHMNEIFDSCLPHIPIKFDDTNNVSGLPRSTFLDAYLSIVAETHFVNPPNNFNRTFVTEKTFNAIANNQMFIIVGNAHSLELLRSLGYKTFDGIIDESYDTILDNEKRMLAVNYEIMCFLSRPIEEIYRDYRRVVDIIEHNRNLLYSQSLERRLQELVDTL